MIVPTFADEKAVIENHLTKAENCMMRLCDAVARPQPLAVELPYIAKQLAFLFAHLSAIRQTLESVESAVNSFDYKEKLLARLRDPAYTPDITEALQDPNAFMDGFREG